MESLIDRVTQGVLARLDKAVQESMGRLIQRPVSEIRSAVEDRMKAVEDTCKDLIQAVEFSEKEQREELASLRLKILDLEHAAYQQKHEANVVFSGLPEGSHAGKENCKSVLHDFVKKP